MITIPVAISTPTADTEGIDVFYFEIDNKYQHGTYTNTVSIFKFMRLNFKKLHFIFLFASIFSLETARAGTISGSVKNSQTSKPIAGVEIKVEGVSLSIYSDSSGNFSIDSIKPGSWNLIFSHNSFEPLKLNDIYVAGSENKRIDAEMNPSVYTLEKVIVRSNSFRRPPDMASSTKIMTFDEVLRSPGALVDVQRAVQELPSVTSASDNTNEIIVRGGNPGENLFIMDNIEIPNPNQFADQGSGGGVVSLINPLLMKGLTFNAGAPPASYGGKASSVLDVKLRDGNDKILLGGVDLGMAGLGLHAEGPLWKGASFMASGSKSYLDLFSHYSVLTALPQYWGMQAKISQKLSNQKIYADFLYGNNSIEIQNASELAGTDGQTIKSGGIVYVSGISWDAYWNKVFSTSLTASATGNSFDRFEYSDTVKDGAPYRDSFFVNNSLEQEQSLKFSGSLDLAGNNRLQAGICFKRCSFDIDIKDRPDTVRTSDSVLAVYDLGAKGNFVAYKYGGYISCILYPFEKFRIVPGIRADKFTYNNSLTWSPRLGAVYTLKPGLDLTGSFGVQYQDPDYRDLVADPINGKLKPKRATTAIAGVEYLPGIFSIKTSLEAFVKQYDNLATDSSLLTIDNLDESNVLISIGEGRCYGIEAFIQKKLTNNFFGTIAYSFSRSYLKDIRPGHEGQWYPGNYDFRNAFTFTGGYKLELLGYQWYKRIHNSLWLKFLSPVFPVADRVELSARWRYLGGRPRTVPVWNDEFNRWVIDQNSINEARFDDYSRLDLRFERRYGFGFLNMIYYFDFQNIYNKKNIWTYIYSDRHKTPAPIYQFQFFPAGGVIIGF